MTQHIALHGNGGVGKTTLASNICAALVEAGFSVVLVGCNLNGDSCSLLHGGVPVCNLLNQIRDRDMLDMESVVQTGFKGVGCVELGNSACMEARTVAAMAMALKELEQLRPFERIKPDYVLYDVSGEDSSSVLHTVIRQVDICRIFVVTTSDFNALKTVNDVFGFLEQYNDWNSVPLPMGGLILNNIANSFEEAFVNDFAYRTNARTIGKVPRSLVVRQCELYGRTVIESQPRSNQSYYYRRLANQIVDATGALYSGNLPQAMSAERLSDWSLEWAEQIYALENGLVSDGASI